MYMVKSVATYETLSDELSFLLHTWKPAVASFPWDFADTQMGAMRELKVRLPSLF